MRRHGRAGDILGSRTGCAPRARFNVSDNGGHLSITIETRFGHDARARSTPRVTPV
jgi:hypothetical protein